MEGPPRTGPGLGELPHALRDPSLTHPVVDLRHQASEGALHVGRVKRRGLQKTSSDFEPL